MLINANPTQNSKTCSVGFRPKPSLSRQSGLSLIELMVALAILTPGILGLTAAFFQRGEVELKARAVSQMVTLQSELIKAIGDEASYSPDERKDMQSAWPPMGVTLTLAPNPKTLLNLTLNANKSESACIDLSGKSCNCAQFDRNCPIKLEMEVKPTSTTPPSYPYAYRITAHPSVVPMPPLGAPPRKAPTFEADDFKQQKIPEKIYRLSQARKCEGSSISLKGANRDTGEQICLEVPQNPNALDVCPQGTLPKELKVGADGKTLGFRCSAPLQTAQCSDVDYVLQVLDSKSLEPDKAKNAQCRMVTKQVVTYTNTYGTGSHSGSITGEVCPPKYISRSICTVVETLSVDGQCPTWAMINTGESSEIVPGGTNFYKEYAPQFTGNVREPPAKNFIPIFAEAGRNVTRCEVQIPPQRCGARWEAKVVLTPKCVLEPAYQTQKAAL